MTTEGSAYYQELSCYHPCHYHQELPPDDDANLSNAAVISTCDAGGCNEQRTALVLTNDLGWLPMCTPHAIAELEQHRA